MIATFAIEVALALFTVLRYRINELLVIIFALLTMLSLFQYSEYMVCTEQSEIWSRIGYAAITTLPALGIHLFYLLSGKKARGLVIGYYLAMSTIMAYFLTMPNVFTNYSCTGNYVIFGLSTQTTIAYSVYYFGLLAISIGLSIGWLIKHPKNKRKKSLIEALVVGYGIFLVPTTTVITIFPDTQSAIPSIMCGFAVLFALLLALYIAPRALVKRK